MVKYYFILFFLTLLLDTVTYKVLKQRWLYWLVFGISTLGLVILLWNFFNRSFSFGDFGKAYYPAGDVILKNPSQLYGRSNGGEAQAFVNIPIVAFLFAPFSFFEVNKAYILFTITGLITVITNCYLLLKLTNISGWRKIFLLRFITFSGPLYYSFAEGNLSHFVLFLLTLAVICIQKKRDFWVGSLLAVAVVIKPPLFVLTFYYLLRKRWQVLVGFSTVLVAIVGASLLLFGVDLHLTWWERCIQPSVGKPTALFNVQSLNGFLTRLLTNADINLPHPLEVGLNFKLIRAALVLLLLGASIWVCFRSKRPTSLKVENLEFSIFLCLTLIISPISWTYYYAWLLLPLSLYLGNKLAISKGWVWFSLITVSFMLMMPPVRLIILPENPIVKFWMVKFLLSHCFYGGMLFLGTLLAARWVASERSRRSKVMSQQEQLSMLAHQ